MLHSRKVVSGCIGVGPTTAIFDYIELFYNRKRPHQTLNSRSPVEYEAMRISLAATGQSQAIEGNVSITAPDLLSTYLLPKIVEN